MIDRSTLLKVIQELEPMPASATRLANIVANENSSLAQIQEVICSGVAPKACAA